MKTKELVRILKERNNPNRSYAEQINDVIMFDVNIPKKLQDFESKINNIAFLMGWQIKNSDKIWLINKFYEDGVFSSIYKSYFGSSAWIKSININIV